MGWHAVGSQTCWLHAILGFIEKILESPAFGHVQWLQDGCKVDDSGLLPKSYVCGQNMKSQAFLFAILRIADCWAYFVAYSGSIACCGKLGTINTDTNTSSQGG